MEGHETDGEFRGPLALAWAWIVVGVPLMWGVAQTVGKSLALLAR